VSTATMPFEPWQIDYHKTMAAAGTLFRAVRAGAPVFELAKDLWSLDRKFRSLVSRLNSLPLDPCSIEELTTIIHKLREAHLSLGGLLDLAASAGLGNRTLTAGSINSLRKRNAELADFLEHLELGLDPSVNSAVSDALEEFRRGETVNLASILK
jgi:hypothetical protein